MTDREAELIREMVEVVEDIGHGDVKIVVKDGSILDILQTIRKRIN